MAVKLAKEQVVIGLEAHGLTMTMYAHRLQIIHDPLTLRQYEWSRSACRPVFPRTVIKSLLQI